MKKVCEIIVLKGQCHDNFNPQFFHQSTLPRSLINRLELFRKWLRIRRDITLLK
jgi:hypothetical protein